MEEKKSKIMTHTGQGMISNPYFSRIPMSDDQILNLKMEKFVPGRDPPKCRFCGNDFKIGQQLYTLPEFFQHGKWYYHKRFDTLICPKSFLNMDNGLYAGQNFANFSEMVHDILGVDAVIPIFSQDDLQVFGGEISYAELWKRHLLILESAKRELSEAEKTYLTEKPVIRTIPFVAIPQVLEKPFENITQKPLATIVARDERLQVEENKKKAKEEKQAASAAKKAEKAAKKKILEEEKKKQKLEAKALKALMGKKPKPKKPAAKKSSKELSSSDDDDVIV